MRYALINPPWSFEGSIYFGCREPHLPLEFGYSRALLEDQGHEVRIFDGQLGCMSLEAIQKAVEDFRPDFAVITTAPSYLFWRCAPPELRVPQLVASSIGHQLRSWGGKLVVVGPHGSTTPQSTQRKLGADVVILGECEEVLPLLAGDWDLLDSVCIDGRVRGTSHASDMSRLPALRWSSEAVRSHHHHHHRFDSTPSKPGAEMEFSRGCPYKCTFCAKTNFRDQYRKRPLNVVLEELDGLIAQGVDYIYFIDEIFLPNQPLLEALRARPVQFGAQTRIDLWQRPMIDLLGEAGCVSIEAGVESITEEGRALLDKKCRLSTDDLAERMIYAKQRIPFMQANLLLMEQDDAAAIQEWRKYLLEHGVWSNEPVPLFNYPGSPDYVKRWGSEDDQAWERAVDDYIGVNASFSDIQEDRPLRLVQLER